MTVENTVNIEQLISDDPKAKNAYDKAIRRIEFRRRWGHSIEVIGVVVGALAFATGCFVLAG